MDSAAALAPGQHLVMHPSKLTQVMKCQVGCLKCDPRSPTHVHPHLVNATRSDPEWTWQTTNADSTFGITASACECGWQPLMPGRGEVYLSHACGRCLRLNTDWVRVVCVYASMATCANGWIPMPNVHKRSA